MKVYLDHAATTPVDKKVLKAMLPYFSRDFGNASSLHSFGQKAAEAVAKARKQTADFFGASPEEIIFTSGATESNNLAIKGVVKSIPHIITSAFEHPCILESCKSLEKENKAEVTYINPNKEGIIEPKRIEKAIKPNTILVSIMYVNNEIGTVQPIAEIGKTLSKINEQRSMNNKIIFHTDATQAVNYFDCDVNKLGVDLLSMSAHKIYGPKGVGALYVRQGTPIGRVQNGGAQEFGKRAGTLNSPGIIGLGAAVSMINDQRTKNNEIKKLRDYLISRVLKEITDVHLNGSKKFRSPNNANFRFDGVEGESLIMMLDNFGIAASTGSACSSGSLKPSQTLLSIGLKPEQAHGSLRITLGKDNTKKEIDYTFSKLKAIINQLRNISGNVLNEFYKQKQKT